MDDIKSGNATAKRERDDGAGAAGPPAKRARGGVLTIVVKDGQLEHMLGLPGGWTYIAQERDADGDLFVSSKPKKVTVEDRGTSFVLHNAPEGYTHEVVKNDTSESTDPDERKDDLYNKYANDSKFYRRYKEMMDELRGDDEDVPYADVVTEEWIGDEICNDPMGDEDGDNEEVVAELSGVFYDRYHTELDEAEQKLESPGGVFKLFEKHRDNAELYDKFKKEISEGEDGYAWLEGELGNDALWEEGDWCYDIEELNDEFSTRRVREGLVDGEA